MDLTNEDVTDILALLDSLPYDELDLQTSRFRLTLRRTPDGWTQAVEARAVPTVVDVSPAGGPAAPAAPAGGPAAPAGGPATGTMGHRAGPNRHDGPPSRLGSDAGPATPEAAAAMKHRCRSGGSDVPSVSSGEGLVAVRAPLPGTFYRAPRPGAAPFVEVGSRVGADTVVGIVETMKLFNSVTADAAGTVAEICLGNAEFADRGVTLLRIRAD
ncbi:MAG: biotin/lipoyl-containing protein [Streptosporangiaceae bacterium]